MTGGHGRRSPVSAAAGAGAPASLRSGLDNKQRQDLQQCLGETPERLDNKENVWAWELGVDNNHSAGGGALVVALWRSRASEVPALL
jgi:hypothetical protein